MAVVVINRDGDRTEVSRGVDYSVDDTHLTVVDQGGKHVASWHAMGWSAVYIEDSAKKAVDAQ